MELYMRTAADIYGIYLRYVGSGGYPCVFHR